MAILKQTPHSELSVPKRCDGMEREIPFHGNGSAEPEGSILRQIS